MALINSSGKYIKLFANGDYEIYPSKKARMLTKNSTSSEVIIQKYVELIQELEQQEELRYYNPSEFNRQYSQLDDEYQLYRLSLMNYDVTQHYPIMQKYFPDVECTIPHIIENGRIMDHADSPAQNYIQTKHKRRWGEGVCDDD